jgi:transcriptional regulator of acetoin/glycerol metabolism
MLQPPAESKTGLEDIVNLEKLKATAIEIAMKRAKGNVSQAAELLGITRYALYRYLEKTE